MIEVKLTEEEKKHILIAISFLKNHRKLMRDLGREGRESLEVEEGILEKLRGEEGTLVLEKLEEGLKLK